MSGAFGIAQNSAGNGLGARDLRKIIEGAYSSPGIITGGEVTGNQNLTYRVEDTVGLVSRGASDGMSMFYLAATDTSPVAAGSSMPRIDTVWVKALDPELDEDKFGIIVGVTQGTPSQSPTPPTLDPTVTRLIDFTVSPYATNLNTGATITGTYDYAIPYGSSLGLLGRYEDTRKDVDGDWRVREWYMEYPVKFYVPTDRNVEFIYDGDVAYYGATANDWMSWAVEFWLDGKQVPNSAREFKRDGTAVWEHANNTKNYKVSKGFHTLMIKHGISGKTGNGHPHFHYGTSLNGLSYPGRTVEVWDRGVAR